jgi:hypothetical protein
MLKSFFKTVYHYYIISKSDLFDRKYYLETYPDVRKADMDPLWHFIRRGWREERNPSASFNTTYYSLLNPDVNNINPLIHYIFHGKDEQRRIKISSSELEQYSIKKLRSSNINERCLHLSNNPLNKPDIIIFPIIDWFFRFQRPQQIASKFAV